MKQVILAPRCYHKYLRNLYRKDDVFFNAKFLTIDDLLKAIYGKIDDSFLYEFLIKKYKYKECKKICSFLPFIIEENNHLFSLKKEAISKNLIIKDEYIFNILNDEIFVYGYEKDDRLLNYLKDKFSFKYVYKQLEFNKLNNSLIKFDLLEEEIAYVFNKIRALYDEGISLNDIYIYGVNNDNIDLVYKEGKRYEIPINGLNNFNADKSVYYKEFLKHFKEHKDFNLSIDYLISAFKDNETANEIAEYLKKYFKEYLSYENLLDIIQSEIGNFKLDNDKYDNAVNILNSIEFIENKIVFILDFSSTNYPKVNVDNDYLSDNVKMNNLIYTSSEKNINSKNDIISFLKTNNTFYVCFAKRHTSSTYYLSYLVEELNLNEIDHTDVNYEYSPINALIYLGKLEDIKRKYLKSEKYLSSLKDQFPSNIYMGYDYSFKPFDLIKNDEKLSLSFTQLDKFNNCPFSFYIDKYLRLKCLNDEIHLKLGNLIHKIFEKGLGLEIDFDELFDECLDKNDFNKNQLIIINHLKKYIKTALDIANKHYHNANNPKIFLENSFIYKLNEHTDIVGKIDKAIITEGNNLWLIDYKSSPKFFTAKNARQNDNLQLPTYALLVKEKDEFKRCEIKGLYFHAVLPKKACKPDEDITNLKYSKLEGVTVKENEAIFGFDKNYETLGESYFVDIPKIDDNRISNKFIQQVEIEELVDIALNNFKNMEENLRENNFVIKPKKDACKYCKFYDVCFFKNDKEKGEEDDE